MQKLPFTELGLSPEILKAVARMGFEEASPIQSATIPVLLTGKDVVGQSQTGSGKTAAFAIPAIEKINPELRAPQALILCPTRELAVQVAEEVAKLAFFKRGIRELPIYGGQSYDRQFRGLQAGAQIIIGTPGRLIDHMDRGTLKLDQLKMVVLDEADRMLDMGFSEDIERILKAAPVERQTVFFSATLPPAIRSMIKRFAREPESISMGQQTVDAPSIDQVYFEVGRGSKLEVLCRLIDMQDIKYGIIFCGTKMMVDELTEHLSARGYAADKLHGDMAQTQRERVMRRFRDRKIEFLVATDVAARGLDVESVEVVFNYDLPQDPEDYIHRIGRTGRAGKSGRAITFVAGREIYKMQQITRFTKARIRREVVPSLGEVEEKRAAAMFESLRETLEKGEYKRYDEFIDRLLDQGYTPSDIAAALVHMLHADKATSGERIPEDSPRGAGGDRGPRDDRGGERREYPQYVSRNQDRPARPERPAFERPAGPRKLGEERAATAEGGERPRPPFRAPESREEGGAPRRPFTPPDGPIETRSHEAGMIRLALNVGDHHEIAAGDVVGVVAGAAKVPREAIGAIRIFPRQTFVDVREDFAPVALEKLKGIRFKGHKLIILPASEVVGAKKAKDKGPRPPVEP